MNAQALWWITFVFLRLGFALILTLLAMFLILAVIWDLMGYQIEVLVKYQFHTMLLIYAIASFYFAAFARMLLNLEVQSVTLLAMLVFVAGTIIHQYFVPLISIFGSSIKSALYICIAYNSLVTFAVLSHPGFWQYPRRA